MMPYTVISGFMSGIGVILVILQLAPFLGQSSPSGGVVGTLTALPELLANIQPMELTLAVVTLLILWFTPEQLKRWVPPQLLALLIGTFISLTLLGDVELRRIPEFSADFHFQMPNFTGGQLRVMVVNGAVLGMLAASMLATPWWPTASRALSTIPTKN